MSNLPPAFEVDDSRFHNLLDPYPALTLLLSNNNYPFAHEAGVFIRSSNELFITSNQYLNSPFPQKPCVQISKVTLGSTASREEIPSENIPWQTVGRLTKRHLILRSGF